MTVAVESSATPARAWRAPHLILIYAAAIAVGWGVSLWAELSGSAALVHHHTLYHSGIALWLAILLVAASWQAMTAAMMLPSSLPFMMLFARVSAPAPRHGLTVSLFTGAYFLVWTGFAATAIAFDWALHAYAHGSPWLLAHDQVIAGGILALAAVYQVSPMKLACLRKCRNPGIYLARRYQRGALAGARLGMEHGLFCLGCCWALMLVMFAVGMANLAWMGIFTFIMLAEKAAPWGQRIVVPVGVGFGALAVVAVLVPGSIPGI
jgi:predicted metal-binding membrane protein